jgi:WD40 repeat protein
VIYCAMFASLIAASSKQRVTILSPDGKYLAVGGTDGQVRRISCTSCNLSTKPRLLQIALHSFPSLKRLWTAIPVASAEVVGATFSSDSALVAFVLASSIQIYSTKTDSSSSASPQVYQTIRKPALKGTSGCVFRGATFGRSGGAGKAGRSDRFYTVVNTNPASGLGSSKKDREKAKIRRW